MLKTNSLNSSLAGTVEKSEDWHTWEPTGNQLTIRDALVQVGDLLEVQEMLRKPSIFYPVLTGTYGQDRDNLVSKSNPPVKLDEIIVRTHVKVVKGELPEVTLAARIKALTDRKPTYVCAGIDNNIWCIWTLSAPVLVHTRTHWVKIVSQWVEGIGWLEIIDQNWTLKPNYMPNPGKDRTFKISDPLASQWCWEIGQVQDSKAMAANPDLITKVREAVAKLPAKLDYKAEGKNYQDNKGLHLHLPVPLWWLSDPNLTSGQWEVAWQNGEGLGVVRPGGIQVPISTQGINKAFYQWEEILGEGWNEISTSTIERETADLWRLNATKEIVRIFDKASSAARDDRGWIAMSGQEIRSLLAERHISDQVEDGRTESDFDRCINYISSRKRIDAIMPTPYKPYGVWQTQYGEFVLNNSKVKAPEPANVVGTWGKDGQFPYLSFFFDHFLRCNEARESLLAVIKWRYTSFRNCNPEQGPALFFEGNPNSGKSLFATAILPAIFGCRPADPSKKMLNGDKFSKEMYETALLVVDDKTAPSTIKEQLIWTNWVKTIVASVMQEYRATYKDGLTTHWIGQFVCCFNFGSTNRNALPKSSAGGTGDKFCSYITAGFTAWPLHKKSDWEVAIATELPYFLSWLLNWEPPNWLKYGTDRFCFPEDTMWQEKEHLDAVKEQEEFAELEEVLLWWWCNDKRWKLSDMDSDWGSRGLTGAAAGLLAILSSAGPGAVTITKNWGRGKFKEQLEILAERPDITGVTRHNRQFTIKPPNRIQGMIEKGESEMASMEYLRKKKDDEEL